MPTIDPSLDPTQRQPGISYRNDTRPENRGKLASFSRSVHSKLPSIFYQHLRNPPVSYPHVEKEFQRPAFTRRLSTSDGRFHAPAFSQRHLILPSANRQRHHRASFHPHFRQTRRLSLR